MPRTLPQPDPPAFDRSLRSAVDPRHAWMSLHRNRIFRIGKEMRPRMAWIYRADQGRHLPTATGTCQRWGGVGRQDRWRHGWRHRAPWVRALCLRSTASQAPERAAAGGWAGPRSGFTACPACPHRPAIPRNTRFCCCCCCCRPAAGTSAGLQALLDPPHTVMVWVSDSQVGGSGHAAAWLPSSTLRRSRGSICGASTCTSSNA